MTKAEAQKALNAIEIVLKIARDNCGDSEGVEACDRVETFFLNTIADMLDANPSWMVYSRDE